MVAALSVRSTHFFSNYCTPRSPPRKEDDVKFYGDRKIGIPYPYSPYISILPPLAIIPGCIVQGCCCKGASYSGCKQRKIARRAQDGHAWGI